MSNIKCRMRVSALCAFFGSSRVTSSTNRQKVMFYWRWAHPEISASFATAAFVRVAEQGGATAEPAAVARVRQPRRNKHTQCPPPYHHATSRLGGGGA